MNYPSHLSKDLIKQAKVLMNKKTRIEIIEKKLSEAGYDDESIRCAVHFVKKEKHKKEMKNGFALIFTAAGIFLLSFLITVVLFHKNKSLEIFMYISTCIGIVIGLLGIKRIFG